jgi:O-methyltransferase
MVGEGRGGRPRRGPVGRGVARVDRVSMLRYYTDLARDSGYSVAKGLALPLVRREAVRSGSHTTIYPTLTYSPWRGDPAFQRVWKTVKKNTLVDEWRCWELWSLLGELRNVPGGIIEIGVWRGGSGALMAARCAELGIDVPVHLCDTWTGIVKTTAEDPYYHDGKHDDTSKAIVEELVGRMGLTDRVRLLQGIFPDDTADQVEAETFRLVHIDVDVYQGAKDILEYAWPRLSQNGIVVFDDFGCAATPGVTKLVEEQRGLEDRLVIHNANGHALLIRR